MNLKDPKWWQAIIAQVIAALVLLGVMTGEQGRAVENATVAIAGAVAIVIANFAFILLVIQKKEESQDDDLPPAPPPPTNLFFPLFIALLLFSGEVTAQTIADTVCRVQLGRSGGSAVVVYAEDGKAIALTAKHVVDAGRPASEGVAEFTDNRTSRFAILGTHPSEDLAAITWTYSGKAPIKCRMDGKMPAVGSKIWKVGYPAVGGQRDLNVLTGQVLPTERQVLRTSAIARSGDSGGGFFHDDGRLAGIVTHHLGDGKGEGVPVSVCYTWFRDT